MDRVYMLDIFKNLGFDIFPTCLANKTRWTKEVTFIIDDKAV